MHEHLAGVTSIEVRLVGLGLTDLEQKPVDDPYSNDDGCVTKVSAHVRQPARCCNQVAGPHDIV